MTDMNQCGTLIAGCCMLGAKQVSGQVKSRQGGLPGKTKCPGWKKKKKGEFLHLPGPRFYDHIISSPRRVTAMMEGRGFLCRFTGLDAEVMYIHFMVISQPEKCTSAAGALAPLPIGLKTIAYPLIVSFESL